MNQGFGYDDLRIGMTASTAKTITEADILMFAAVSTDMNPMHMNAEAAARTVFGERIAHGMLTAGLISAVLGMQLPGPGTIYLSLQLKFRAPVKIGNTVNASVEVVGLDPVKKFVTLRTICRVGSIIVVDGEALVKPPMVERVAAPVLRG